MTSEQRAARKLYDGSVRRKDRKKLYRELEQKRLQDQPEGKQT
jgi:hypothetical protein